MLEIIKGEILKEKQNLVKNIIRNQYDTVKRKERLLEIAKKEFEETELLLKEMDACNFDSVKECEAFLEKYTPPLTTFTLSYTVSPYSWKNYNPFTIQSGFSTVNDSV